MILVAGVVHGVERLQDVAGIERAPLRGVASRAERERPGAIVIGTASRADAAVEAIRRLKGDERGRAVPVLHLVAPGASCGSCGAELCLPADAGAASLVGAVRLLLRLGLGQWDAEALAASQRLVALGRVAGGVVHDFNNLLLVISGHVELTRRLLGEGHAAAARLEPVLRAVERAGALARQLLAFGRGVPASGGLASVNAVLAQLEPLLRRLVGDYVRVEVRVGRELGLVRASPAQLEQLLLNLVLNGRDAMPSGGRLTLEAQDVEIAGGTAPPAPPGRYVMLAVSDEGVGMDGATRERIFEPFFTTKPPGAGSGLGLATVQQVVEQAGGTVAVDSEPGRGSTFRVYLPVAGERSEAAVLPPSVPAPCGRETVLVAEGSEPVREITRELLEELGYTVLTAASTGEALRLAREWALPIDVVLADVAMPGTHGSGLSEELLALRPRTRVLLSGEGEGALPKPFTRDRLARAIRELLDARHA